jgi:FRG domain
VTKKNLIDIDSVSTLVQFVEEVGGRYHIFRGQQQDHPLLPKIARGALKGDFLAQEQRLLREFKIRSTPYVDTAKRDDWDWLAIGQHYGMATRLLDWSANPLCALWFAVKDGPKDNEDGVVWMFSHEADDIAEQDSESPFEGSRTKLFQPKHLTRSIVAQNGWFTVHKYIPDSSGFVAFEKNRLYKQECKRLRVPRSRFLLLESQLDRIGINESTIFPNIEGLCRYLNFVHLPQIAVHRFPRTVIESDVGS